MKTRTHIRSAVPLTLAALAIILALAFVLASCGGAATPSTPPSTIYPQSSATGTLPALKTYLGSAQDVLAQVSATVGTLPDALQGMSAKPDATWSASAAQLQSIAAQLGDEASALAALQPPSALKPVHDAVVKGIQAAQSGVDKLAAKIGSGQQKATATRAEIRAQVDQYRAQIQGLADQLRGALGSLGQ